MMQTTQALSNQQLLLIDLAKLLNMPVTEINMNLALRTHPYWDSLSVISLIGAIDEYYKINISGEELMAARIVSDIFKMLETKLAAEI